MTEHFINQRDYPVSPTIEIPCLYETVQQFDQQHTNYDNLSLPRRVFADSTTELKQETKKIGLENTYTGQKVEADAILSYDEWAENVLKAAQNELNVQQLKMHTSQISFEQGKTSYEVPITVSGTLNGSDIAIEAGFIPVPDEQDEEKSVACGYKAQTPVNGPQTGSPKQISRQLQGVKHALERDSGASILF